MSTQTNTNLNGLDPAELSRLIGTVDADPSTGLLSFRAATSWTGGMSTQTTIEDWTVAGERKPRGYTFAGDEPPELLGKGTGPNPQELLLAALNSCMAATFVAFATLEGVRIERLSVESEGDIDLRGFFGLDEEVPQGLPEIRTTFRVSGDAAPEVFEKLLEAVKGASAVLYNVTQPVQMIPTLVCE